MTSPLLTRATRNALILRWLAACDLTFRCHLVELRAMACQCPTREVDPSFTGPDEMDWLAATFRETLAQFAEDEL